MAVTFKLKKPSYEWRVLSAPSTGSDLFLRRDIEEWLVDRNIRYHTYCNQEEETDGYIYLYFYISFDRQQDAILFKLTWM